MRSDALGTFAREDVARFGLTGTFLRVCLVGAAAFACAQQSWPSASAGSPAAKAGVRIGDVIDRVGKFSVTDGVHYHLGLIGRGPGQALTLTVTRGGKTLTPSGTLGELTIRAADKLEGLVGGLKFAAYRGSWTKMPDFDKLGPADAGKTTKFAHNASAKVGGENYGLKFTAYIHAPRDGNYTFYTASDDGSQVFIGDQLVVDHDGLHGATEKNAFIRLKAGKHPITVLFFQRTGGIGLKVSYEGPGVGKQEIPSAALFIKP